MEIISIGMRKFLREEQGATAVEYGMMVGLIAVAVIVTVASVGTEIKSTFTKILTCLQNTAAC